MLVGSLPDLLTSGSASATAWQEESSAGGLDGSGSPSFPTPWHRVDPALLPPHPWMSLLEEGVTLALPARAQDSGTNSRASMEDAP